jgi:hypothetical protein
VTTLGAGGYELLRRPGRSESSAAGGNKPNILVIVVDQMRAPQWFPEPAKLTALLPNIARLQRNSVSFESHYTASNACTPSRGVMTTGLYSHQTGCLFTGAGPTESSTLAPQFPTWGTLLRERGYKTWWWGKWHLGNAGDMSAEGLEAHGFSGGTFPSPNGAPQQGLDKDPDIVDQFNGWFEDKAGSGPWCTTVSLVNPHDICWWPKYPLPENIPLCSRPRRATSRHPTICADATSRNCRSTTSTSCRLWRRACCHIRGPICRPGGRAASTCISGCSNR